METETLSLTKGNNLVKKRFNLLMKGHKDFFEEKEPDHFYNASGFGLTVRAVAQDFSV